MEPSDLTAVPPGVLDDAALEWLAAGEQAGNAAVSALTDILESPAVDELGVLASHLVKILALQQEYGAQSVQTTIALLKLAKDDGIAPYRLLVQAMQTVLENPLEFGQAFVPAFIGFYVQDVINTAKLIYESALLLGYLNECLAPDLNFGPAAEATLEISRYLAVADVLGPEQACQPVAQIARQLDAIVDEAARLFNEDGTLLRLAGMSATLVEETLDFIITLSRALPTLVQGPLSAYVGNAVDDPATLGRLYGIAAAVVIGFASGIEEVLVLATGLKVIRPIVVGGGIVGGLLPGEVADDPAPLSPLSAPRAAAAGPAVVRRVLRGIGNLTEQELGLIEWLMLAFDEARAARRLEQAGYDSAEIARAMRAKAYLADMRRYGYRAVDEPSMRAAADLQQHLRGSSQLLSKLRPVVQDVIQNARYQMATYNRLSRDLRVLNSNLDRLYYLTQGGNLSSVERLDFLKRTSELMGSLFEAAHIIDKKFIDTTTRAGWASVAQFRAARPKWFVSGVAEPGQMPCIALLATDHRILTRGMPDVWGVTTSTLEKTTVTAEMERMFRTLGDSAEDIAATLERGGLVVGPDTRAIDIVMLQRKIYENSFPEVFARVRPTIDDLVQALQALP